jgi:nicotinic acid phosphoribosyltransferase
LVHVIEFIPQVEKDIEKLERELQKQKEFLKWLKDIKETGNYNELWEKGNE